MGGFGSGYQGPRKQLVENSLTLSISDMMRLGAIVPGKRNGGQWSWNFPGKMPHARIGYVADVRTVEGAALRLFYEANGHPVDNVVKLTSTRPHFGGRRWWFICPAVGADGRTGRRVAKLHLPPGERYFASRRAHGLTYRSCRESGQFRAISGRLAKQLQMDPVMLSRAMKEL